MQNNSKKLWAILGSIIIIILVIVGINNSKQKKSAENGDQPYKLGVAFALTGDGSVWGQAALNGAKLAVEEINNAGGVKGRTVELVVEDSKSSSKDSVLAVSKLQDIDRVDGLMATWLDSYPGPEGVLKPGMVMISPDAGIEAVNGINLHENVFASWYRTQPKSDLAIKHMADTGKKKLYIITQKDGYYETAAKFMTEAAQKHGVEIVGIDFLNPDQDIKAILPKVAPKKPDAVFFAFYDQKLNSEFLKRAKTLLGNNIAIYGDEFVPQNYQSKDFPAESFEGVYFYSPVEPDAKFKDLYVKTYGKDPIFGAAPAYDSVKMFAQMWKENPADTNAWMRKTTFNTVSFGKMTFDEIGGVKTDNNYFTIKQVQNGVAVDVLKK